MPENNVSKLPTDINIWYFGMRKQGSSVYSRFPEIPSYSVYFMTLYLHVFKIVMTHSEDLILTLLPL